MTRRWPAPRRNGHSRPDPEQVKAEAERALQAGKDRAREVQSVATTLKKIREQDGLATLFGDALGGV